MATLALKTLHWGHSVEQREQERERHRERDRARVGTLRLKRLLTPALRLLPFPEFPALVPGAAEPFASPALLLTKEDADSEDVGVNRPPERSTSFSHVPDVVDLSTVPHPPKPPSTF